MKKNNLSIFNFKMPIKKQIYSFFIFLIGLVVLIYSLDVGVKHVIKCIPNGDYGTLNRLVEGEINAEILITGSSRANNHFNPDILSQITRKSCYNIGQNGEQLNLQLPLLKLYLKYNKPPKLLIQSLDIFSTTYSRYIVNKQKYYPYLDEPIIYEGLAEFDNEIVKMKYIPLYGYVNYCKLPDIIHNYLGKKDKLIKGFRGLRSKEWDLDYRQFKKENPQGRVFPIDDGAINNLKEIIKICKKHDIKMVFVFSPEYWEAYQFEKNRSEIIDLYKTLALENDILFFDYSNTSLTKQKALFCNANHLNIKGANLFSEDIARRLIEAIPWL